jgi:hypothetical protein
MRGLACQRRKCHGDPDLLPEPFVNQGFGRLIWLGLYPGSHIHIFGGGDFSCQD